VPVWHGIVALPTVGHVQVRSAFPVGAVDVVSARSASRIEIARTVTVPLDGTNPVFTPARQQVCVSRGLSLRVWVDNDDPYHGFGEPRPPMALSESDFAEWSKLVDEAWDVLTLNHPALARELVAGLRALAPIEPNADTVGASASAAFGGIRLSANGSAADVAEALVHEMQHSKLNALLLLAKLADDTQSMYLAPWRDDPRPVVGVIHGVYAFTCGVEFWLAQEPMAQQEETRRIAFGVAHRRVQIRRALDTLTASGHLTRPGEALVDIVSTRLARCEQAPVDATLVQTATMMVDDHRALWRLRHARPDPATVNAVVTAWLDGGQPPVEYAAAQITPGDYRRLPANRRTLLRAKATEPDLFASLVRTPLPGPTPRADAALCTGDYAGAAAAYTDRLATDPDDAPTWAGLGLALRAQGRHATALLEHPELTVAVHRRIRTLGERPPEPTALCSWLSAAGDYRT